MNTQYGIDDAGDRIGDAAERESGEQDDPRADSVDHESDRRLQHGPDTTLKRVSRQRQLGIADQPKSLRTKASSGASMSM